jgi:GNAT superfamily N-acetyltransferase
MQTRAAFGPRTPSMLGCASRTRTRTGVQRGHSICYLPGIVPRDIVGLSYTDVEWTCGRGLCWSTLLDMQDHLRCCRRRGVMRFIVMNTKDLAERVLAQRMNRFMDAGPSLEPYGSARFHVEGGRLRVAYAMAHSGRTESLVERVLRFARERQMQVQWTVVPARRGEEDLCAALEQTGFEAIEHLKLMGHQGLIAAKLNPNIVVYPINSLQEMWQYEQISRLCFYDDAHPSNALLRQRALERWREQQQGWCRYFQAFVGNQLAGGCYVSAYEDVPTIMGVCTLPEARRQGVATALLTAAVHSAMMSGDDQTCLFVERGNPAENLYREVGFFPLVETHTYLWSPLY